MKLLATALALICLTIIPCFVWAYGQDPAAPETSARESAGDNPRPAVDNPRSSVRNPQSASARPILRREVPDDPYMPTPPQPPRGQRGQTRWTRGPYVSVQVNVDELGDNIVGDAANEPSIAIDPVDPGRIVIGWRQFDSVASNFRQAGWGYSHDAGQTWTFPGVLEPGVFRSDPVLDFDVDGNFYYFSIRCGSSGCGDLFKSIDGGVSWWDPVFAFAGDKPWMTIDRTEGIGRGNIYGAWGVHFIRSTDGGLTFMAPIPVSGTWGTVTVSPGGVVYVVAFPSYSGARVSKSGNAQNPGAVPVFDFSTSVDLGGTGVSNCEQYCPNPGGLVGQPWIACDHSEGQSRGNVYVLCSVWTGGGSGPLDLMFVRSTDEGVTWSEPIRVSDDPTDSGTWHWFGTMSVAPNGRIDAVWNDTRTSGSYNWSELFYASSVDGGLSWSENVPVSPPFDSHVGWPQQNKIGDYYHAISDNSGMNVAYAATFNGEQDVYFLHIPADCNGNGVPDEEDLADGTSTDCNQNDTPDDCEPDCNGNGTSDSCEIIDGTSEDCDGDWVPDECEPDFDGDGFIDDCDPDMDNDGVPNEEDVCGFTPLGAPVRPDGSQIGDSEHDCDVDLVDYARLKGCLSSSGPEIVPLPWCLPMFNYDGDNDIDLVDFMGFSSAFTGSGE